MNDARVLVRIGDLRVAREPSLLITVGIGSCVAIVVHDPAARVGGLAHALLPEPQGNGRAAPPGRFAASAVRELLEMLKAEGADPKRARAWLVGGARIFEGLVVNGQSIGERNVAAARRALELAGVPVRGEAVGGERGRSVYFDVARGRVRVTAVQEAEVIFHD